MYVHAYIAHVTPHNTIIILLTSKALLHIGDVFRTDLLAAYQYD